MNRTETRHSISDRTKVPSRPPGGICLVIDPSMNEPALMDSLNSALSGGIDLLQIWSHWPESFGPSQKRALTGRIRNQAQPFGVPVFVNEEWELPESRLADGVHLDRLPEPGELEERRRTAGWRFLAGITCDNDLTPVHRARTDGFDYISFCAMFPSSSAGSCEIVRPETVRKAGELTDLPLFVSGGVTPDNLEELRGLPVDGIAVISGILHADSPATAVRTYRRALDSIRNSKEKR